MAEMGTMVASPSTPVAATALAMVPSHDLPIIPTLPVAQLAVTSTPAGVWAVVRPLSQSMTALAPLTSSGPPTSSQPLDLLVPARSAATKAYPRGCGGGRPAVEPVDDRLGSVALLGAADVLAALGLARTRQIGRYEGVPARVWGRSPGR